MKQNIKIAITPVKLCYSISFVVILAFIVGISSTSEIGIAMDANMAFLAAVFCADTYDQELQANRWEVFYLLPSRTKFITIGQRILLQIGYLALLISIGYWFFFWQKPAAQSIDRELPLYLSTVLACTVSSFFFAVLSFTMVNLIRNLWAGIGVTLAIWFMLNPTFQNKISFPKYISIFQYQSSKEGMIEYMSSAKVTAILLSFLLLIINYRMIVNGKEKVR